MHAFIHGRIIGAEINAPLVQISAVPFTTGKSCSIDFANCFQVNIDYQDHIDRGAYVPAGELNSFVGTMLTRPATKKWLANTVSIKEALKRLKEYPSRAGLPDWDKVEGVWFADPEFSLALTCAYGGTRRTPWSWLYTRDARTLMELPNYAPTKRLRGVDLMDSLEVAVIYAKSVQKNTKPCK